MAPFCLPFHSAMLLSTPQAPRVATLCNAGAAVGAAGGHQRECGLAVASRFGDVGFPDWRILRQRRQFCQVQLPHCVFHGNSGMEPHRVPGGGVAAPSFALGLIAENAFLVMMRPWWCLRPAMVLQELPWVLKIFQVSSRPRVFRIGRSRQVAALAQLVLPVCSCLVQQRISQADISAVKTERAPRALRCARCAGVSRDHARSVYARHIRARTSDRATQRPARQSARCAHCAGAPTTSCAATRARGCSSPKSATPRSTSSGRAPRT
jgi:hypothetical protein